MVLWPNRIDDVDCDDRHGLKSGDRGMSRMYQREGFKAVECVLEKVSELVEIVRIKEIYLKRDDMGGHIWHVHVDNDVFEAITDKSMQHVYQSDNEADGPIVQRVNLQTSKYINLFTIYELGAEADVSD